MTFFGSTLEICSIVNAKSGLCSQDSKFCAQSGRYNTNASVHPFLTEPQIMEAALQAETIGAQRFGIVTSGHSINQSELQKICRTIQKLSPKLI